MHWLVQKLGKHIGWPACAAGVFALLYVSSYSATLWLPASKEVDTRSQITADYSPWTFVVFQRVDPAIIEEIKKERELPEEVVKDGLFWPTSTKTNTSSPESEVQKPKITLTSKSSQTPIPQTTFQVIPFSPTVSLLAFTPTSTQVSTELQPSPAKTISPTQASNPTQTPESTATPNATQAINPTKIHKPTRTPTPHNEPKPTKTP